ncbi:polysaccharide biosynthesis-domain-containing protein [Tuber borchii]|uniref:Protein PBDC1 homolog n=1 Tax=Tuber borchii TaxID=42251 RepID=A0A2T6ZDW0_TUBBO|nr:polysaccharide biosynthesis-domain-containing protein [Tuber borchii]
MSVPKNFKAEEAQNLQDIEKQFAVKAVIHAQTYWSILERRAGTDLRLTRIDQEIYDHLLETFPDFDPKELLNEDEMKSKSGKEKWRSFLMRYEKRVEDYNFGTLLRTDAKVEYEKDTTIFVPRMQFYAIEIARNRSGLNDWIKAAYDKEEEAKRPEAAEKSST